VIFGLAHDILPGGGLGFMHALSRKRWPTASLMNRNEIMRLRAVAIK
jgi:hypothetical protein